MTWRVTVLPGKRDRQADNDSPEPECGPQVRVDVALAACPSSWSDPGGDANAGQPLKNQQTGKESIRSTEVALAVLLEEHLGAFFDDRHDLAVY